MGACSTCASSRHSEDIQAQPDLRTGGGVTPLPQRAPSANDNVMRVTRGEARSRPCGSHAHLCEQVSQIQQALTERSGGCSDVEVSQIQQRLTENKEQLVHIIQNRSDWKLDKSQSGIQIYTKEFSGPFRATGLLVRTRVKAPVALVLQTLFSPQIHDENTIIEPLAEVSVINERPILLQWWSLKVPLMSPRDLSLALQQVDNCDDEGSVILSTVSVQHGGCGPRESHRRARLVVGGWHIRPLSPTECGVHWISICDMVLPDAIPTAALALGDPYRNKQIMAMIKRMKQLSDASYA